MHHKHKHHKPLFLFPKDAETTKESLLTTGGVFFTGLFFGWLFAGCPNIFHIFSAFV